MKNKLLILPDIHHKTAIADQIVELELGNFDKVIFTGDALDAFGDEGSNELVISTAEWFKAKLNDPDWVVMRSNHQHSYEFSDNGHAYCPGFTKLKSNIINGIITRDDWNKQKTYHYENGVLFNHAGLSKRLLVNMPNDLNTSIPSIEQLLGELERQDNQAMKAYGLYNSKHPLFYRGYDRGGDAMVGGLIWEDFSSLVPLEGIVQIVGHTPHIWPEIKYISKKNRPVSLEVNHPKRQPKEIDWSKGVAFDLDTGLRHYGLLDDMGRFFIYEIVFNEPTTRNPDNSYTRIVMGKELMVSYQIKQ